MMVRQVCRLRDGSTESGNGSVSILDIQLRVVVMDSGLAALPRPGMTTARESIPNKNPGIAAGVSWSCVMPVTVGSEIHAAHAAAGGHAAAAAAGVLLRQFGN